MLTGKPRPLGKEILPLTAILVALATSCASDLDEPKSPPSSQAVAVSDSDTIDTHQDQDPVDALSEPPTAETPVAQDAGGNASSADEQRFRD